MKTVFIYAMATKEQPDIVKYIGKTNNIDTRLSKHLGPYYLKEDTHKAHWIQSELNLGNTPILFQIDEVPESDWQYWEKHWIAQFKSWGFNLVNGTIGGDGMILTDEILKKRNETNKCRQDERLCIEMELYKVSEKDGQWVGVRICQNCNNSIQYLSNKRGKILKQIRRDIKEQRWCVNCDHKNRQGKNNSFFGKHHTIENIQKLREADTCKRIVMTDLYGNTISEFNSLRDAERSTGIHRAHISKCCKNKPSYNTAGGYKWHFVD